MKMEITLEEGKKVNATYKGHIIKTDQPIDVGGENTSPAPFDLFLASIGTCAGYYVKAFCQKRDIPTENIKLVQTLIVDSMTKSIDTVKIEIQLPPDFPEKYKDAVVNSANLCAVKKQILNPPQFEVYASTK